MRRLLCSALLSAACSSSPLRNDAQPGAGGDANGGDASAGEGGSATGGSGQLGNQDAIALEPGEVAELGVDADGTAAATLSAPNGDEQFVVIVSSTRADVTDDFSYSVDLNGAVTGGSGHTLTDCSLPAGLGSRMPLVVDPLPTGAAPERGSKRSISIAKKTGFETVEIEAVSVGEHAVVWADSTNGTELESAFVSELLDTFENMIMPRERTIFGTEPDSDGDGRVNLIFSPVTNDSAVAFFTGCDLDPGTRCKPNNHGEYIYVTPPADLGPPYNTVKALAEVLAHEFSHMLHYNRKVYLNGNGPWTDSAYMAEGVGGFAEDVTGYQAGNFFVMYDGLASLDEFSLANVLLDGAEYDMSRDGLLRGGAYLFVRYLYDRGGGDHLNGVEVVNDGGPGLLRALIDPVDSIATVLPELAGHSTADIMADFYTALAMSNRDSIGGVAPKNPCFAYLPTQPDAQTGNARGANVFGEFRGTRAPGPHTSAASAADGRLRGGGVEYLTLSAKPGSETTAFTVRVDAEAAPRIRVGRWQ